MNILKKNVRLIIGIIIGVILVSGISIGATVTYLYNANEVKYNDEKSVADALDDLYNEVKNNDAYTITFSLNHGTSSRAKTYRLSGEKIWELPTVTESDDYMFLGWYLDSSYNTQATIDTVVSENITIYAKEQQTQLISNITDAWAYGKYYKLKNGDIFISTNTDNLLLMIGYKGLANWSNADSQAKSYNSTLSSRLMTVEEATKIDGTNTGATTKRADTNNNGPFKPVTGGTNPSSWLADPDGTNEHYKFYKDGTVKWSSINSYSYGVRPVVTIPSDARYLTGDGTSSNPYQIINY